LLWFSGIGDGHVDAGADKGGPREAAVRANFARQSFMTTLGAELVEVGRGTTRIEYGRRDALCQQHCYLHAGVATAIADTACGYAALSMAPEGSDVVTIEFKSNFLRSASGDRFEARGRVVKPGAQIMVCEAEVWELAPSRRLIVTMAATMFVLDARNRR
jgi:uncharacterized protein (TIGR00369 family)